MSTTTAVRFSIFGLFLAALLGSNAVPSIAAADYSVQPRVLDRTLEPRDTVSDTITLRNTGNRLERVYATVSPVELDSDGDIESFAREVDGDNRSSVTHWLNIERGRIELAAGEERSVRLGMQIHPQAEPGVYHAFVGFASGRNRAAAEETVRAGQAPGTLVRIEIGENRTSYLRLDQFLADRFVLDTADAVFTYTIENPGDTPQIPRGEVIIYNTRGEEVGAVTANPDGETIEPGESKTFTSPIPESAGMGRHRAYLSLNYGENQLASLQDTIFFFQVPIWQLVSIFLGVLATATGVAYWVHRRYAAVVDADEEDRVAVYHDPARERPRLDHDLDLKRSNHSEESYHAHTDNDTTT